MGFLQVDVSDNSTTAISRIDLQVKNESGALVMFTNGSTTISYQGVHGLNRLAAQWDAAALPTGAHKYTIIARTLFADNSTAESSDTMRVIIVNDRDSYLGAGWSVGGLQQVHASTDGAVVTNGDGSAVYFRKVSSSYITPPGEYSTLTWNGAAQKFVRLYPDSTRAEFDSDGYLLSVMDRFERAITYTYNSGFTPKRISSISDGVVAATQFTYTATGLNITDPGGRATTVTVGSGNLTTIKGPDNIAAFTGTYDSNRQLKTRTDRRGKTWGYAYDFAGKLSADTMPAVKINGGATPVRPVVRYLAWESAALVSNTTGVRTRVDPGALRAHVTDPNNATTKFSYDRHYGPTLIEAPLGHTTTIRRNLNGLPEEIIHPNGATTRYGWDDHANVKSIQQPETDKVIYIDYDAVWKTDPWRISNGGATRYYTYGTEGQLLHESVGTDTVDYEYDTAWRLKKVTDPQGHTATYSYHTTGSENLSSVVVNFVTTSYAYDAYGRTASITTPTGTSHFRYDIMNRDTSQTDPMGRTTRFSYDGDLVSAITDASGKLYQFRHNALG